MSRARGSEPAPNRRIASTNSPDLSADTHAPAQAPADVPMTASASPRSKPSSARPLAKPAYQAAPMGPPPPSTKPNALMYRHLPLSPHVCLQLFLGLTSMVYPVPSCPPPRR